MTALEGICVGNVGTPKRHFNLFPMDCDFLRECLGNSHTRTLCRFITPCMSRPDLREPFYFSIWLGQGVKWGGHSIFCFLGFLISMFWPGMVLNQGQLSIVVSDWDSYLGRPFSLLSVWVVNFVRGTKAL